MLSKIIILNSAIYAKAVVILDSPSIQIVANNNTGKSSFINTLNFLFIIAKKKMEFGDHEWKETLNHYFPQPNTSCILFEIFVSGRGYKCVLVNRNTSSDDVNYYIVEREWAFLDTIFFSSDGELINFQNFRKELISQGINTEQIERDKLFDKVYSSDATNYPVVQITSHVKRQGRSLENSFTRIYKYLISPKSIDSEALKEALITADNRQNESLIVFADSSQKDSIVILKNHNEEIQKLKSIEFSFKKFKQVYQDYLETKAEIGREYYLFDYVYQMDTKRLSKNIESLNIENGNIQNEIDHTLIPLQGKIYKEIGSLDNKIETENFNLREKQRQEDDINLIIAKYGSIDFALNFLTQKNEKLTREISDIQYQLNEIEKYNLSEEVVQRKLTKLNKDKKIIQSKLEDFDNLILSKLTENEELQRFLNTIFSAKISSLSKNKILQSITKPVSSFDTLEIYGGLIDVSDVDVEDIETIEILTQKLSDINNEISRQTEVLEVIKTRKTKEQELKNMQNESKSVKSDLDRIDSIAYLQKQIKEIEQNLKNLLMQKNDKEKEAEAIKQNFSNSQIRLSKNGRILDEHKEKINKRKSLYETIRNSAENLGIEKVFFSIEDENQDIDKLYEKIKKDISLYSKLKSNKDEQYESLKIKLDNNIADTDRFISEVNDKLASIPDLEKCVENLLDNISSQFTKPIKGFLQRYDEFKSFIKKFNNEISQYQISNIQKIEIELNDASSLISDLELIISIKSVVDLHQTELFDDKQKEALEKLNQYLEKSKNYEFGQLFDINLNLIINDRKKTVNLSKQVESEGTDKTLKLILFMLIIKRFFVRSENDMENNKVVLFVDEILKMDDNNVKELIRFCHQNGFLPIFAAKSQASGVEKFYFLHPSAKNQNKIIIDKELQTSIVKYV
jgi:hypothetical protein